MAMFAKKENWEQKVAAEVGGPAPASSLQAPAKPGQPLKYGIAGAWSRRITEEHRLVYQVIDADLVVLQARYHYAK